jgi:hypothetical protein
LHDIETVEVRCVVVTHSTNAERPVLVEAQSVADASALAIAASAEAPAPEVAIENLENCAEEHCTVVSHIPCAVSPRSNITDPEVAIENLENCAEEHCTVVSHIPCHHGDSAVSPRSSVTDPSSRSHSKSVVCCPCCLGEFEDADMIAVLKCGHLYCEECIRSWAIRSTSCPFCRASMLAK